MAECSGCREYRRKHGMTPSEKVFLPMEVTLQGFRKPELPVVLCPHCDGDSLVNAALAQSRQREAG